METFNRPKIEDRKIKIFLDTTNKNNPTIVTTIKNQKTMNTTDKKIAKVVTKIVDQTNKTEKEVNAVVASAPANKSNAEIVSDIKKGLKKIVTIKRNIMKDIKDIHVNQLASDCQALEQISADVKFLALLLQTNVSSQNK
jgi:succinyl-CoA synthetase alpha subunit